jgi:hypothetical protein
LGPGARHDGRSLLSAERRVRPTGWVCSVQKGGRSWDTQVAIVGAPGRPGGRAQLASHACARGGCFTSCRPEHFDGW